MQVLNTGTTYRIYDETMRAYNQLPASVYKISFNQMTGYSLIKTDPIEINEKIYGQHMTKVDKVYKAFEVFPRNLGVILSGAKGIGKSLFAKMLSIKAIENGYPIIICDAAYPGIADFLGSIQQEVVILFDEFDKTFRVSDDSDPQADMLTLFDGLYMGKKLFIVTCNELKDLNDYLVNRPGRFHYHFRFEYPVDSEITEYLMDNVNECYHGEIPAVVDFARKVNLNYDCLRAIAFELNMGYTFADTASDLNIVNVERVYYTLILYFKDGTSYKRTDVSLDLFDNTVDEEFNTWLDNKKDPIVRISFIPSDNVYDYNKGGMVIPGNLIELTGFGNYYDDDNDFNEEQKARIEKLKEVGIDFLMLKRQYDDNNIHYII